MLCRTTSLESQIQGYFCAPEPYFQVSFLESRKAHQLVSSLLPYITNSPLQERKRIFSIVNQLYVATLFDDRKQSFKDALHKILHCPNWKDALLQSHRGSPIDLHFSPLNYSNALDLPITSSRFVSKTGPQEIAALYGSTFATNKPHRLNSVGHQLLDAAYGSVCYDANRCFTGFALALGDGGGGHFGDDQQDRRVARAAHFGAKACVRLLSLYTHPAALDTTILRQHIEDIKEEVRRKGKGESTTLVACRAFPVSDGFEVIGFNIGDTMLSAWHPDTQTFRNLLPAIVTEAGTALLPDACRPFEIQFFNALVPSGAVLFLMSDGIHDMLPHTENTAEYSNGLQYRMRRLQEEEMSRLLFSIDASRPTVAYLQTIVEESVRKIEGIRQESTIPDVQIGDDALVLGCRLAN